MRRLSKSNAVLGQDTEHTVTTLKTVQMFQMDEAVHAAMLRAEWQAELLPVESLFFSLSEAYKRRDNGRHKDGKARLSHSLSLSLYKYIYI